MSSSVSIGVVVIWTIFSLTFFYLAHDENRKSNIPLKSLEKAYCNKQIGNFIINSGAVVAGVDICDFVDELQQSNKESHSIASVSYFLAGLVALFSTMLAAYEAYKRSNK